ncbi:MAG: hypothetical protein IPN34_25080 [Planctomycetes bacterium]|nr:hypothetical protein [Planctomycetota bacterium]
MGRSKVFAWAVLASSVVTASLLIFWIESGAAPGIDDSHRQLFLGPDGQRRMPDRGELISRARQNDEADHHSVSLSEGQKEELRSGDAIPSGYPYDPNLGIPEAQVVLKRTDPLEIIRSRMQTGLDVFKLYPVKLTDDDVKILLEDASSELAAAEAAMEKYYADLQAWTSNFQISPGQTEYGDYKIANDAAHALYGAVDGGLKRIVQIKQTYSGGVMKTYVVAADPQRNLDLYRTHSDWMELSRVLHDRLQYIVYSRLNVFGR